MTDSEDIKKNFFLMDVWSVKNFGVQKWYENFSSWPISEDEKYEIYSSLKNIYKNHLNDQPKDIADVLIVLYKLIKAYHSFLYCQISINRLREKGYNTFYESSGKSYFKELIEEKKFIPFYTFKNAKPTLKSYFKDVFLSKARNVKYKLKQNNFSFFYNEGNLVCFENPKEVLLEYALYNNKKIHLLPSFALSKRKYRSSLSFDLLIESMVQNLVQISKKHGLNLRENQIMYLKDVTQMALNDASELINFYKKYLGKIHLTKILIPSFGQFHVRALCIAAKQLGHQIIGSTHGNNVGFYKHSQWYYNDLILCTEYIVPTAKSIGAFEKYASSFEFNKKSNLKISKRNKNPYQDIFENLNKDKLANQIKTVMIMGYPHSADLPMLPFQTSYFQLWLIIKISVLLKQNGFKTILKLHPDRLLESNNIYDKYFDKIISEKFEVSYKQADAIILPELSTTCLPFSLLTKKTLLAFRHCATFFIAKSAFPNFSKRVHLIDSKFSDDGKLIMDEEFIIKKLKEKPKIPNYSIIDQYYFDLKKSRCDKSI